MANTRKSRARTMYVHRIKLVFTNVKSSHSSYIWQYTVEDDCSRQNQMDFISKIECPEHFVKLTWQQTVNPTEPSIKV